MCFLIWIFTSQVIRVLTPIYATLVPHEPLSSRWFWIMFWLILSFLILSICKLVVGLALNYLATWYINYKHTISKQHVDWLKLVSVEWRARIKKLEKCPSLTCTCGSWKKSMWFKLWSAGCYWCLKLQPSIISILRRNCKWSQVANPILFLLYCVYIVYTDIHTVIQGIY